MTTKIILSSVEGVHILNTEDIVRLEAKSNYTNIYFTNRRPLMLAKVLKNLSAALEPMGFIRTHRSHLVNRRYIAEVHSSDIILQDSSTAEISRRKKREVMQLLRTAICVTNR